MNMRVSRLANGKQRRALCNAFSRRFPRCKVPSRITRRKQTPNVEHPTSKW